jgi:hypothetical protein
MAPVSATSTGIARQTIDDPKLVELIRRLSVFDGGVKNDVDHGGAQDIIVGGGDDSSAMEVDDDQGIGFKTTEGAIMDVGNDVIDDEAGGRSGIAPPMTMVAGLVAALDSVPKWQFQEQVSCIRCLFAIYDWSLKIMFKMIGLTIESFLRLLICTLLFTPQQ